MADIAARAPGAGRMPSFALFAGLLAMAGLPIYLHAPKFYVDEYGVGLAALGGVLFALRFLDFVQDPLLGWLAAATRARRREGVAVAGVLMAAGFYGLFAVPPPMAPLAWFALTLTVLFSAFSFLTVCFYAQGAARGEMLGLGGHVRLATWRETGALVGVSVAAVAPTGLALLTDLPFSMLAAGFVLITALALVAMHAEWGGSGRPVQATPAPEGGNDALVGFRAVLGDRIARRLLLVALVNAMPVAVTSTLFLFFVESRLAAPGWEGPLLLLFFAAAALSVPFWGRAARRFGAKRVLLAGMGLAVVSFAFAALLGPGDVLPFAIICVASGAALGADMSLLSAIFSRRMAAIVPDAAQGFGLWAFVTKATLALAAVAVLPALGASGFASGAENPPEALVLLTVLYALIPCALKLLAIVLLAATPLTES